MKWKWLPVVIGCGSGLSVLLGIVASRPYLEVSGWICCGLMSIACYILETKMEHRG
jgi:hypothetical protein